MAPSRSPDPAAVRRVLLVRPRFMGDVCLTLPALDALRAACPSARVAYVVERPAAPLLEGDPRVDELIVAEPGGGAAAAVSLAAKLRRFAPDVAFDFFCNPRTALWTFLSGAPVRVGYPGKGWRSGLYTQHAHPRTLSATGFHLASLEALGWGTHSAGAAPGSAVPGAAPAAAPPGGAVRPRIPTPRLHVGEAARAEAARELASLGVPPGATCVGFHAGARWMTRRWDPANFAALAARYLAHDREGMALVTGGPEDGERTAAVIERLDRRRARAVVGWPLARFVALQQRCRAFVCGDTGPLHTAVAAGTPTLGLLSRNRPAMFFPYDEADGHRAYYARVECSPCHRDECDDLRCLKRLTVDGAWGLLQGMLERAT